MQQRLWKLFFHEDCEWPPGSGTICDEPMYGPPELMPPKTNTAPRLRHRVRACPVPAAPALRLLRTTSVSAFVASALISRFGPRSSINLQIGFSLASAGSWKTSRADVIS